MSVRRMLRLLLMLTALGHSLSAGAEDESSAGMYLAKIAVEGIESAGDIARLDLLSNLTVRVKAQDNLGLANQLAATNVQVIESSAEAVVVTVTAEGTFNGPPTAAHENSSWVVDYDQPVVAAISKEWASKEWATESAAPEAAELTALVDFAGRQIHSPNYQTGFAIASQIARRRAGDCTEYAVLQTALARADGRAARVVFGMLLAITDSGVEAWGHAWSEIHDGAGWTVADATQPGKEGNVRKIYYLPVMLLENEGPGHAFELLRMATLRPNVVELIAAN